MPVNGKSSWRGVPSKSFAIGEPLQEKAHQAHGRPCFFFGNDQRRRDPYYFLRQRAEQMDAFVAVTKITSEHDRVGPLRGSAAGPVRCLQAPDHAALFAANGSNEGELCELH